MNSPYFFDWSSPSNMLGNTPTSSANVDALQHNSLSSGFNMDSQPARLPQDQSSVSVPAVKNGSWAKNHGESSSIPMERDEGQSNAQTGLEASQRKKYHGLDWQAHKTTIKSLYLEGDKNLEETMAFMEKNYGFIASKKLYKGMFKQWKWQKNLPGEYAQWMVVKSNKRQSEAGKDTDFLYGGLHWTKEQAASRAKRAKKGNDPEVLYADTPAGVTYETPQASHLTPRNDSSDAMDVVVTAPPAHSKDLATSDTDDDAEEEASLRLMFQGASRTDLIAKFAAAKSTQRRGDAETAEQMLVEVLAGYEHILGSTHEDTNKVTYALATFYAETDRMTEANNLIENMTQKILDAHGVEGSISQQHVLHVVELLNAWGREIDALAFLTRAKDFYAAASRGDDDFAEKKLKTRKRRGHSSRQSNISSNQMREIVDEISITGDPAMMKHGIDVARAHVAVKDVSAAALLNVIIKACSYDPTGLAIENLDARSQLLSLFEKSNTVQENSHVFQEAVQYFQTIWERNNFNAETFKSFEIMEACLKLAVCLLKSRYWDYEANSIFRKVEQKSADIFGPEDERTIWVLISIGLVYQTQRGWKDARQWFDQAYAFALAAYSEKDGILMSLRAARENQYFSYLSDEGRPFKTIFGVSGITIRPGRLHLD